MPLSKLSSLLLRLMIAIVAGLFGALGEELGWRGYLYPALRQTNAKHPMLITGAVWALWHIPLVAWGGYYTSGSPWLIALAYAAAILAMNGVACALMERSGRVSVATIFHASHNFFFQIFFPLLIFGSEGENSRWWEILGGDCGFIPALLYLAAFQLLFQSKSSEA